MTTYLRCTGCGHDLAEYAKGLTLCAACEEEEIPERNEVHLVRVDGDWFAYTNMHAAWTFYKTWNGIRDCEFRGGVTVDPSSVEDVREQWGDEVPAA